MALRSKDVPAPVGVDFLDEATVGAVAALDVDTLARLDAELRRYEAVIKGRRATLEDGLHARYGTKAAVARGGPFGTAHIGDAGWDVKVVVDKRIDWDQDKLAEACRQLEAKGTNPDDYVRVRLTVLENNYKACPTPIRALFDPARTLTPGKPRFTFTARDKVQP